MILTLDTIQSIDEALVSVLSKMEGINAVMYIDDPNGMEKTITVQHEGLKLKLWYTVVCGGLLFCGSRYWNQLTHFEIFAVIDKIHQLIPNSYKKVA